MFGARSSFDLRRLPRSTRSSILIEAANLCCGRQLGQASQMRRRDRRASIPACCVGAFDQATKNVDVVGHTLRSEIPTSAIEILVSDRKLAIAHRVLPRLHPEFLNLTLQ